VEDHCLDSQHLRWRSQEEDLVKSFRVLLLAALLPAVVAAPTGYSADETAHAPAVTLLYVSREDEQGARGSLSDPVVADYGWLGAHFGVNELNVNGQFVGRQFEILRVEIGAHEDLGERVRGALSGHPALIVADLNATDLLTMADLADARGGVIVDARTSDDSLRHGQCRGNVFHVLPSWEMRADALGRFLSGKTWRRWVLLNGPTDDDRNYSKALREAAHRTGAAIVSEAPLPAPTEGALTQAQLVGRLQAATHIAMPYDVVLVTDASGVSADGVMYNTALSRLVAGTQGLRATAWDPQFRDFAARGFGYRFDKFASREMTERDFGNWLAVTVLGEAVLRGEVTEPAAVRQYLRSRRFSVASFKGEPLVFNAVGQQLRQPILLFGPRVLVALMPDAAGAAAAAQAAEVGSPCSAGSPETR
jgi:ABC transporter substrate binding protein (PQQ-dependent alcohol dehydrogenase system)